VGIAALIVPLTKILGSSECPSAYILAGISVPMYLPHLARVGIAALIVPSTKRLALVKRSFRVYTCGHPCTNVLSTFCVGIAALIVPSTKILGSSKCPSAYILAGISVPMYLPHLARVGIDAFYHLH